MYERPLARLYCDDLPGPSGCCGSCHEDCDDYGYPMIQLDVPPSPRGRESRVEITVCCTVANGPRPTRSEIAAAVLKRRSDARRP